MSDLVVPQTIHEPSNLLRMLVTFLITVAKMSDSDYGVGRIVWLRVSKDSVHDHLTPCSWV